MTRKFLITVNNEKYEVLVEEIIEGEARNISTAMPLNIQAPTQTKETQKPIQTSSPKEKTDKPINPAGHSIVAPLPGVVLNILVKPGEKVTAGQTVLILEAMKMENEISSPIAGTVSAILVYSNQNVNTNDILAIIE